MQGSRRFSHHKLAPRSENLLKKPDQMQGGRRFSYITVNFHPEVRFYLKRKPYQMQGGRHVFKLFTLLVRK